MRNAAVTLPSIRAAATRIEGVAAHTPTYYSKHLSTLLHTNVHLKLECYQPIRVFKLRGAVNKLKQLPPSARTVVTLSAGNHGLAVAYAASRFNLNATIVVPEWAVPEKVAAIEEWGGRVVKGGSRYEELRARFQQLLKKPGHVGVHPFADPAVIAGQGTAGLEILEDAPETTIVVVPVGGGGLISGVAIAVKTLKPQVRVIGVQAQGAPAVYRSFKAGRIVASGAPRTIADGMATTTTEPLPFRLMQQFVDDMVLVDDGAIAKAMYELVAKNHILVEPAGAAPLAAVTRRKIRFSKEDHIVLVISGANPGTSLLRAVLQRRIRQAGA